METIKFGDFMNGSYKVGITESEQSTYTKFLELIQVAIIVTLLIEFAPSLLHIIHSIVMGV